MIIQLIQNLIMPKNPIIRQPEATVIVGLGSGVLYSAELGLLVGRQKSHLKLRLT
ncbi:MULTISPECIES: hypothetical protein [Acinetobacter]|uniref:hypothetical protein n=1 Tax=Acinetobacter TaxID=469 RepID=UPI0020058238|nr:hypothetical protein [Acinetobacter radioresistens]MCK4079757.1 hypothetical protein [Acinetobacter radioresistens]MCK4104497.1 hypothetical protein [Acinetobacter radioresistens]MCU4499187.1 hypothetical protein [Acinetobacter radioresistens]MCX0339309.1 hypothetical protein [Acinetobacter radioresistens]